MHKLSIIRKDFFLTYRKNSINHEDIFNIVVETGPLFATLKITTKFFSGKQIVISHLKKSEAILAKRLVLGLIISHKKGVTLRNIEKEVLLKKLEQLGSSE